MVQRTHVVLEDDLDGGEAVETVKFSLDGTRYEIDLNEDNAATLRKSLAHYVAHARKDYANGRTHAKRKTGPQASEVREWARSQGMKVPERGRMPREMVEAFSRRSG